MFPTNISLELKIKKYIWLIPQETKHKQTKGGTCMYHCPVAPVAYQVILEPGIGQFREFEPRRVHTRVNSLELFLVHKLTCGKRESVS